MAIEVRTTGIAGDYFLVAPSFYLRTWFNVTTFLSLFCFFFIVYDFMVPHKIINNGLSETGAGVKASSVIIYITASLSSSSFFLCCLNLIWFIYANAEHTIAPIFQQIFIRSSFLWFAMSFLNFVSFIFSAHTHNLLW